MVAATLAATQPAVSGDLRVDGGMEDISASWHETAAFLASQDGPVKALVLPGSGFAVQEWGRTIDEPIQVLGAPPWLARAQVTVAPAGTLRVLDSLEDALGEGRPSPASPDDLRRLGITHVVVRNDLAVDIRTRRLRTSSTHRSQAPTTSSRSRVPDRWSTGFRRRRSSRSGTTPRTPA